MSLTGTPLPVHGQDPFWLSRTSVIMWWWYLYPYLSLALPLAGLGQHCEEFISWMSPSDPALPLTKALGNSIISCSSAYCAKQWGKRLKQRKFLASELEKDMYYFLRYNHICLTPESRVSLVPIQIVTKLPFLLMYLPDACIVRKTLTYDIS